jgi:Icc-related predicted phosphoesterase
MRLKAKWFSCTLINVPTPTNKKMEVVNEELYNLLEQNINKIANYLLTIY